MYIGNGSQFLTIFKICTQYYRWIYVICDTTVDTIKLQCLVAFELKIGKFKPEYISKMDFYLEALDRQKKKENENPSVGMILCASKDDEVVEYAMSRTLSPMMVAEYKLQLPDKAVLQKKLQELINMPLLEDDE